MPRNLTNKDKEAIVKQLTGGWSNIFRDTIDIFQRDEFVAGNETRSPLATVVRDLSRLQCRRWARADKSNFTTRYNQVTANICGLYLDSISEKPADGSISSQFTGGQCNCSRYSVAVDFRDANGSNVLTFNNVRGPIGTLRVIQGAVGAEGCNAPQRRYRLVGTNRSIGGGSCLALAEREYTSTCSPIPRFIGSVVVTPQFGDPNNCGDPGNQISDPNIPTGLPALPPTQVVTIPAYGDVTASVTINPDGSFEICIEEIDTCFTIDPTGLADDSGPGDIAPTDPGEADTPENTGPGGEASGCASDDQELTGVLVEILAAPIGANTFNNINTTVYRGIGYVSMGYEGLLGVDVSAGVVESPQFFHAQARGLQCWRVTANIGFNLKCTPYYRDLED